MWIRPCHRQETEDIPDCLLGATITTGGSIMTEDLRMQKKKTHKQTSSHTRHKQFVSWQQNSSKDAAIWLVNAARLSPHSAWLDSSYDRHAGKRTITGKVRWLSGGEKETRLAQPRLGESRLLYSGLRTELSNAFGISQTPIVDSCRPPDITLITQTFFDIRRRMSSNWVWATVWAESGELGGKQQGDLIVL